ncbi:signal peptidase II [Anaerocolumna sp. MB42-C2]|uniref:signal peptidase II n=1 Tax=Anaerocolumna sp. MB42-C2 TaxID=3070997 RepID=UPI0027E0B683|nr:signal peptidase II [Anaerocolumna sp. MB42-C2]WMJ90182.1 signal peptidase II [Anaerocolumna sp. MB42-C2]
MIYILIAVLIFITEYIVKKYIEENKEMYKKEEILNGNIILERYHNKGAMLNFMEDKAELVKKITVALVGVLIFLFAMLLPKKGNRVLKFALALILGGALSNVHDRLIRGYVVDYFSFKFLKKIIFNISDICIFLGSALITLLSIFKKD